MKRFLGMVAVGGLAVSLIVLAIRLRHRVTPEAPTTNQGANSENTAAHDTLTPPAAGANAVRANSSAADHVSQPSVPDLSPTVLSTIGQGDKKDFRSRLQSIGQLGTNLSGEERQALYRYLHDTGEEKWLRPGQAFALKNDILNKLREQQSPPSELTDILIGLRQDFSQPLVIRDYALQHLAPWYANVDSQQKEKIVEELRAASQETDQSYAGTALLALHRVQQQNPGVQIPTFTDQIVRLIEDGTANLLARITAVQLTSELGLEEARESISRLAGDESQAKTLRIAAVAALGRIQGNKEHAFLHMTARGTDERLKWAAASALKNQNPSNQP